MRHILVSASAGSGKTFQLVRRHVHLLALGQRPEEIAAMTFTRKAAGEFFQRILRQLSAMAQAGNAQGYLDGLRPAPPEKVAFGELLRSVTRRLHKLRLGTMDSFFANIAACFPLELGLPLGARVMAEDETRQAQREALEALLERVHAEQDGKTARALLEGYKQATFGHEERGAGESLEGWIKAHHDTWLESDSAARWGRVPGLAAGEESLAEAVKALRRAFQPENDEGIKFLEELESDLSTWEPGTSFGKRLKFFLEKTGEAWPDLEKGSSVINWARKKVKLDGMLREVWMRLARTILHRELACRAQRTTGMAALMELYESEYARRVRGRGRLSFADVQRLLAKAAGTSDWLQNEDAELWFRLDSRYEHWLFDEFQDTSRVQWGVVKGLVDEVMQDDAGRRSFYAVGDPKQSIYLWRQAEPGLFDEVLATWPHREGGEEGLRRESLSCSYRSAPAVLDAVNAVFGEADGMESLVTGCTKGFEFQLHRAAERNKDLAGHAALLCTPKDEEPAQVVAALLKQLRPLELGLSCAVLVRGNSDANEMADTLRAETGMEIVCESQQHPATDNAVTLALLSLLQYAAHPDDTMAREHLRMTPLREKIEPQPATMAEVRSLVFEKGFIGFTEVWTRHLREVLPAMDAFHERRLRQFGEIAAEFDARGSRDIDAFLQHARETPMSSGGAAQAVQVMTVHKSKGLEFDVVILPGVSGDAMNLVRPRSLVVNRDDAGISWVLQEPPRALLPMHHELRAEFEAAKQRAGFESLCRLYVAMTRAKRGLYLVAKPPPKTSTSVNEAQFLRGMLRSGAAVERDGFQIEWETGNPAWFAGIEPRAKTAAQADAKAREPLGDLLRRHQAMPRRVTPSGEEDFQVKGSVLFSEGREPGRRLGTLVHELLARVEWDRDLSVLEPLWAASGLLRGEPVEEIALRMVREVLASPELVAVFTKPSPEAQVWRERSFDMIHNGNWISGTFDRVIVGRDFARLIDFKTDDLSAEGALEEKMKGYAPQIALYRQAIALLTGLPLEKVSCELLFTRQGRLVEVEGI
ncbi:MAG: UvrD-helicase domain-containing protein [Prosthecobacter sp.]